MKLSELDNNTYGRVVDVDNSDPKLQTRLQDLGFIKGTTVYVRRRAPLQSPIEFEVRGTTICLRTSEADLVIVEPIAEP